MRRLKLVLSSLIILGSLAYMSAPPAQADTVLLSGGGWTLYNSNTNAYKDFTVGGETLRITLESYAYVETSIASALTYSSSGGFGVTSAAGNSDLLDSGTGSEMLTVTFSRNVTVSGYGMSDWSTGSGFTPKVYNFSPYQEVYLPTAGGSVDGNGFMSFTFTGKPVVSNDFLRFFGATFGSNPNDGLGLARLDVTVNAAPVPIPGAVWLLGSGLVGLVALRRRFRK